MDHHHLISRSIVSVGAVISIVLLTSVIYLSLDISENSQPLKDIKTSNGFNLPAPSAPPALREELKRVDSFSSPGNERVLLIFANGNYYELAIAQEEIDSEGTKFINSLINHSSIVYTENGVTTSFIRWVSDTELILRDKRNELILVDVEQKEISPYVSDFDSKNNL